MRQRVTKAIFPVAGMGTRFLPATKSIPKEIMTLVDRPLVQYAIDEARAAGIKEFIFVTSRGKGALEDYFDHAHQLEYELRTRGKFDLLKILESTNMESGAIAYVRQHKALGLGHAIWCARRLIADEPFAVMLPDDVIAADPPCLRQMIEAYEDIGGNIIASMEVPRERASAYGILEVSEDFGSYFSVDSMVEKPNPSEVQSNLAIIGRYILTPSVLANLDRMQTGAGGEIQLTDAISQEIGAGGSKVYGFRFTGQSFDCGSKIGFLKATVAFGLSDPHFGADLREYLQETVARHHDH
ncbi:MAG: UTP--glucose-1-phosphate uridylyltransferase [Aestuariivita sp.]|nr:UTP--glucose-1-phosphate uridylyltransferase [Aestuariivita sp.]